MAKQLLIIGAGGFGREILAWAQHIAATGAEWTVSGFLDGNPRAVDGLGLPVGVVGDPASHVPLSEELFACAVGDPATKLRLCRLLQSRGGRFATLIHPTALVGPLCRLGDGAILCPFSSVTTNVTLGNFVTLNTYSAAGHDSVIGDGCTLNSHSAVNGRATLGEGVMLGCHAVVNPSAKVGNYARIGAGSVVIRRAAPHTTVMGVPAKRLWTASSEDQSPLAKAG